MNRHKPYPGFSIKRNTGKHSWDLIHNSTVSVTKKKWVSRGGKNQIRKGNKGLIMTNREKKQTAENIVYNIFIKNHDLLYMWDMV